MVLISRRILSRTKTQDFLSELEKSPANQARSLYLPPGLPRAEVEVSLKEVSGQPEFVIEMAEFIINSRTGAALFRSPEQMYLVLPPFPIPEKRLSHTLSTEQLHSLLEHDYMVALILVRLGAYAIGIGDGENLISSKVGTGLVHGRHKKGGSSAHRFERHRDKQIEYFLTRVCQRSREQIIPYVKSLDYVVYGGARTTILLLQKRCSFLSQLDTPILPPLLEIPEPRQAILAKAIGHVWSSTVMEWGEG